MDPATAFAVASTAFSAIKAAFEHGREIESMIGDFGRWTSAVWDINRGARKERERRKAFGMSVEEEALQSFVYQKQIKQQEYEIAQQIKMQYGPNAWEEVKAIQASIRRQKLADLQEYERKRDEYTYYAIWGSIIAVMSVLVISLIYTLVKGIWFS
jgi:hypothetical protein